MIRIAGLVALAVLPALGLVVYFYLRDRYEPEAPALCGGGFHVRHAGADSGGVPGALGHRLGGSRVARPLGGVGQGRLYDDFLVAAAVEEGLKWVIFWVTITRWREFDEPMDGCVYGATMALGLATVENLYYVLIKGSLELALLRGLLSIPAHALYGASMGYFIGRAKFTLHRKKLLYLVPLSLAVPWAFHGTFDHLCNYRTSVWGWVALGAVSLAMWLFVTIATGWALGRSPFKDD